jgi:hypothetical protein
VQEEGDLRDAEPGVREVLQRQLAADALDERGVGDARLVESPRNVRSGRRIAAAVPQSMGSSVDIRRAIADDARATRSPRSGTDSSARRPRTGR